jgi:hypothetical protein
MHVATLCSDVRYWHLADIMAALRMFAFGGKADTIHIRTLRSANDPKRTLARPDLDEETKG